MTKEEFIALGLTEEQATKAAAASAKELEGFIPKARFDEVNDAKKQAEKEVAERDKQLETLKADAGASETLKAEIAKLQEANEAAKKQYEADLKDIKINAAVEKALTGAKAKHPDLLLSKIDKTKLVLDGDKVVGLDDQIKPLKEAYKELFEPDNPNQTPPGFHVGGGGGNPTPAAAGASLKDAIAAHFQSKS